MLKERWNASDISYSGTKNSCAVYSFFYLKLFGDTQLVKQVPMTVHSMHKKLWPSLVLCCALEQGTLILLSTG